MKSTLSFGQTKGLKTASPKDLKQIVRIDLLFTIDFFYNVVWHMRGFRSKKSQSAGLWNDCVCGWVGMGGGDARPIFSIFTLWISESLTHPSSRSAHGAEHLTFYIAHIYVVTSLYIWFKSLQYIHVQINFIKNISIIKSQKHASHFDIFFYYFF